MISEGENKGLTYSVKQYDDVGDVLSFRSTSLNKLSSDCESNSISYFIGMSNEVVETNYNENTKTFADYYNENSTRNSNYKVTKAGNYYLVPQGVGPHDARLCSMDDSSISGAEEQRSIDEIVNLVSTIESN